MTIPELRKIAMSSLTFTKLERLKAINEIISYGLWDRPELEGLSDKELASLLIRERNADEFRTSIYKRYTS